MHEGVVIKFEVVDIDQDHRERCVETLGVGKLPAENGLKIAAVGDIGELIGIGKNTCLFVKLGIFDGDRQLVGGRADELEIGFVKGFNFGFVQVEDPE